jgi:nucleotide-binding universal stress UspA family protein
MAGRNDDGPVLFAYDGSDHAKAAIRRAGQQLRSGRRAIVLTVWEPETAEPFSPVPAVASTAIDEGLELEARRVADEGAELARRSGFDAKPSAEPGLTVWRRILDSAGEHDAAIVVVGSHGRTGLSRLLMGSNAAAAASHSDRPVLIVHGPVSSRAGDYH